MSGIVQVGGVALASHDSGTDKVSLDSGTVFPAGHVLNVVQTVKTDTTTTSSLTFEDMTGMTVSITPGSTGSKILVFSSLNVSTVTNDFWVHVQMMRDATPIFIGDTASNRIRTTATSRQSNAVGNITNLGSVFLDSPTIPSTPIAIVYKIQWRAEHASHAGVLNQSGTDTDNNTYPRTASSITVMEIAG